MPAAVRSSKSQSERSMVPTVRTFGVFFSTLAEYGPSAARSIAHRSPGLPYLTPLPAALADGVGRPGVPVAAAAGWFSEAACGGSSSPPRTLNAAHAPPASASTRTAATTPMMIIGVELFERAGTGCHGAPGGGP